MQQHVESALFVFLLRATRRYFVPLLCLGYFSLLFRKQSISVRFQATLPWQSAPSYLPTFLLLTTHSDAHLASATSVKSDFEVLSSFLVFMSQRLHPFRQQLARLFALSRFRFDQSSPYLPTAKSVLCSGFWGFTVEKSRRLFVQVLRLIRSTIIRVFKVQGLWVESTFAPVICMI